MKDLNRSNHETTKRSIKIMQFGEGNFLRAFVDWILQDLNDKKVINSNVVVVQPMPMGRVKELAAQDGLYTLCLEGIDKGEKVQSKQIIDVLGDFVNPFEDYEKFLSYGRSEDLEVIISNTTEAGIALDSSDTDFSKCPKSFPGKLLALLKARYDHFKGDNAKGLAIIPCELIDYNGVELKRVLNELAKINNMDQKFIDWVNNANHFTSTLVDRIVPGYPRDKAKEICEETGFNDNNIVKGEIFHLWVLQKEAFVQSKLPADKSGLNVIFADDITPYKQRKVRILNGAHTSFVLASWLCGNDIVRQSMEDADIRNFMNKTIFEEVIPTLTLPEDELKAFAGEVVNRFNNPYVDHALLAISLNSVSKWRARCLPSLLGYVDKFGKLPAHMTFSIAALMAFYTGTEIKDGALVGHRDGQEYSVKDDLNVLEFFRDNCGKDTRTFVENYLGREDFHGQDLNKVPGLTDAVVSYLDDIKANGMRAALCRIS